MDNSASKGPPRPSQGDHALTAFRAALSAIPVVGGPAVELLTAIVNPPIAKRRDEWIQALAEEVERLVEREQILLETLTDNPVFVTTVVKASHAALRNHQVEKLAALRNAVLHVALSPNPDDAMFEIFIELIDSLTVWHLRLLKFFDDPVLWVERSGRNCSDLKVANASELVDIVFIELAGRAEFYRHLVRDLENRGLIADADLEVTAQRNAWTPRTTEMGKSFLLYIEAPEERVIMPTQL